MTNIQMKLAFASMCVEGVARKLGRPYREVLDALVQTDVLQGLIFDLYEPLHSQSYDWVIDTVVESTQRRGGLL